MDELIWCSSERHESIQIQYFKVVLLKIICNTMKTCSNSTHVSFCLARFKKINNDDFLFIKKLNAVSQKNVTFFLF